MAHTHKGVREKREYLRMSSDVRSLTLFPRNIVCNVWRRCELLLALNLAVCEITRRRAPLTNERREEEEGKGGPQAKLWVR